MKTYQDLIQALNIFIESQNHFLTLSHVFYLNLVEQIRDKAKIPNGHLITFKTGTNYNSNLIEDCVSIKDNASKMIIELIIDRFQHQIHFQITKQDSEHFKLIVYSENVKKEFSFGIEDKEQIENLDFEEVIGFIGDSIMNIYYIGRQEYEMRG